MDANEGCRVMVSITEANPELAADLAGMSVRARAERLRQLALLGLMVVRHGLPGNSASPSPSDRKENTEENSHVRNRILGKLAAQLSDDVR